MTGCRELERRPVEPAPELPYDDHPFDDCLSALPRAVFRTLRSLAPAGRHGRIVHHMPPGRLGSYRMATWIFPGRVEQALCEVAGRCYRAGGCWERWGELADGLSARVSRARAWWLWRKHGRP